MDKFKRVFRGERNGKGKKRLTVSIEDMLVNALAKKGYIVTRKAGAKVIERGN